jgi:branched-chain amino acid transport system substrate-binding protein
VGEIAIDALKRTQNVDDKESILNALKTTKLNTIAGPVDFTAPVAAGTVHPVPNVYTSPLAIGQWVRGMTWPYDLTIVGNGSAPGVPVQSQLQLLP